MRTERIMANDGIPLRLENTSNGYVYLPFTIGVDVSTSGDVVTGPCALTYVAIHPTAASGSVVITDGPSGKVVFRYNTPGSTTETRFIGFPSPLSVYNSLTVTLTNVTVTLGYFQ